MREIEPLPAKPPGADGFILGHHVGDDQSSVLTSSCGCAMRRHVAAARGSPSCSWFRSRISPLARIRTLDE
jgi:hypothetical protein